ncbi:MAG: CoA pyrophosphatase [Alphaproteobacteria bacterium]|nr:CoA pyrophosphatase [Alphaproteobacteria bacterium]
MVLSHLERPLRAWVRERLTAVPAHGPASDYDLNPGMRTEAPPDLTAAGVLVPIIDRPGGATVLLTRRSDQLRDHAGQVSFPGGRIEADDSDAIAAAMREAEEEIGLDRRHVEVMGTLARYETRTGFVITPVVAVVEPRFELAVDSFEVAEVFEVPLAKALDEKSYERHTRIWRGAERHFYVLPHERHFIWGATAGMLVSLCRRLGA